MLIPCRKGVMLMTTFQVLSLLIAFGMLVAYIMSDKDK